MAPRHGTRTSPRRARAAAGGGAFGTTGLAGLGVVILAATALLPAYTSLRAAEHRRDCLAARTADMSALVAANERLLHAARHDPTFIKRLAISQGDLVPAAEVRMALSLGPYAAAPDVVVPSPSPRPDPPPQWLSAAADRVASGPTRRGLLLISGGLILTGMLLFARPPVQAHAL